LIIGNGFDLQCGLKSKYSDFFEWLRQDNERANNFWAVYFLNNSPEDQGWIDIESSLQEILNATAIKVPRMKYWVNTATSYYTNLRKTGLASYPESQEANYIIRRIENGDREQFQYDLYWFLDELIAFGRQFSKYLKFEVSRNTNYLTNVIKLLDMLLEVERTEIISFNYTNPFDFNSFTRQGRQLKDTCTRITNVHGTYDENSIIFGVDTTEEFPLNVDAHIFTKTHRKMLQRDTGRE